MGGGPLRPSTAHEGRIAVDLPGLGWCEGGACVLQRPLVPSMPAVHPGLGAGLRSVGQGAAAGAGRVLEHGPGCWVLQRVLWADAVVRNAVWQPAGPDARHCLRRARHPRRRCAERRHRHRARHTGPGRHHTQQLRPRCMLPWLGRSCGRRAGRSSADARRSADGAAEEAGTRGGLHRYRCRGVRVRAHQGRRCGDTGCLLRRHVEGAEQCAPESPGDEIPFAQEGERCVADEIVQRC
mmetsp:Transcript_67859/g.196348  ORF Transcript_67859/g.196348 Transcript_67859/m.196348 type:complete len:238 (+) Transcript_67859:756-1469(+)